MCNFRMSPQATGAIPRVSVGFRHEVETDLGGLIKLVDPSHYEKTVTPATWRILTEIANDLRSRKVKASFFNATPQGGGGKKKKKRERKNCIVLIQLLYFIIILKTLLNSSRTYAPCADKIL